MVGSGTPTLVDINGDGFRDAVVGDGLGQLTYYLNNPHDKLNGGSGNDSLRGEEGNDTLYGYSGNDYLDGGDNNDTLSSGGGDDTLGGGNNFDTAVYTGQVADYAVSFTSNGSVQVIDTVASNGNDGTDILTGVEQINFAGLLCCKASSVQRLP